MTSWQLHSFKEHGLLYFHSAILNAWSHFADASWFQMAAGAPTITSIFHTAGRNQSRRADVCLPTVLAPLKQASKVSHDTSIYILCRRLCEYIASPNRVRFLFSRKREEIPGVNEQSWPTPSFPLLALPSVQYFSSSESKVLEILRWCSEFNTYLSIDDWILGSSTSLDVPFQSPLLISPHFPDFQILECLGSECR